MKKLRSQDIAGNLPATVAWVIIAVATLVAPLVLSTPQVIIYVTIGLATMVVAGLSLLMGFAGQVSLGQAAFYAIGAYSAAIMAIHGWPPLLALVLAPVITAATAGLLGLPLLRLKGHALAFGTLAVQLIVLAVLAETPSLTGGDVGLSGIPALKFGGIALTSYRQYAYLVWVVAAIVLLVSRNITSSRPGRGLRAMATSPPAASAAGVNVVGYKLRDFALSAAYAGLAGGIYAFFLGYVAPGAFPVMLSIEYVIMVVVGGLGTVSGAFIGAGVVMIISQILSAVGTGPSLPPQLPNVLSEGVYAVMLIAVLRMMPGGIVGLASRLTERVRSRLGPPSAAVIPPDPLPAQPARAPVTVPKASVDRLPATDR